MFHCWWQRRPASGRCIFRANVADGRWGRDGRLQLLSAALEIRKASRPRLVVAVKDTGTVWSALHEHLLAQQVLRQQVYSSWHILANFGLTFSALWDQNFDVVFNLWAGLPNTCGSPTELLHCRLFLLEKMSLIYETRQFSVQNSRNLAVLNACLRASCNWER